MKEFKMPETISLNEIGPLTISTVKLNSASIGSTLYETCLFTPEGSRVVNRYRSRVEAIAGHNRLAEVEMAIHANNKWGKEMAQTAKDNPKLIARWKNQRLTA